MLVTLVLTPAHAITMCVGIIILLPPSSLLLATSRWLRSSPQGTSAHRVPADAPTRFARATPLTCARADALRRAF
eukprot:550117-Pleurochrysis_carterae.AAC.1